MGRMTPPPADMPLPTDDSQQETVGLVEIVSTLAFLALVVSVLGIPSIVVVALAAGVVGLVVGLGLASLRQSRTFRVRPTKPKQTHSM